MRKSGWMLVALGGFLATVAASPALARDETKIKLDDLPKKVMAAAKKAFPEGKLVGATKETDDDDKDELLYVVAMTVDDRSVEVAIDADGEIEAVEREIDAADLPRAVTRAAAQRFPNGKVVKVAEVSDADDDVVYELDINDGTKKVSVVMSPNGKILDVDDDDDDDDKKKEDDKKKDKDKKDKDGKKKGKDAA